jgi:regulatory protein
MMIKKTLSKDEALQKAKHYCDYQKRCQSEVRVKLYAMGLKKNDVEGLITQLIEENYLNDESFAIAFARGRFRLKHWGKVKIKNELKLKRVSEYCIGRALAEINEKDYHDAINKEAKGKLRSLQNEKSPFIKKRKLSDYLQQKGYERGLINNIIAQI